MKSSIVIESKKSLLAKKLSTGQELKGRASRVTFYSPRSSSPTPNANTKDISPTGSNKSRRKISTIPEEVQSSTLRGKFGFMFYSTNLVEHRIVQPGSHCFPFHSKHYSTHYSTHCSTHYSTHYSTIPFHSDSNNTENSN